MNKLSIATNLIVKSLIFFGFCDYLLLLEDNNKDFNNKYIELWQKK